MKVAKSFPSLPWIQQGNNISAGRNMGPQNNLCLSAPENWAQVKVPCSEIFDNMKYEKLLKPKKAFWDLRNLKKNAKRKFSI